MKWFQALTSRQGSSRVRQGGIWVRQVEHGVLRVVSLAFSLGSAHAIRWFFSPLDGVDNLQIWITWMIAIGFGVLGYFVSRGLAHRIMNQEKIWAYAPICIVVEFVEIFCNYALAAAVIAHATWLGSVPAVQRNALTFLTYVALSIIPLVSLLLAVVDVDLERNSLAKGQPKWGSGNGRTQSQGYGSYASGYGAQTGPNQNRGQTPLYVPPPPANGSPNGTSRAQAGGSSVGSPLGVVAPVP